MHLESWKTFWSNSWRTNQIQICVELLIEMSSLLGQILSPKETTVVYNLWMEQESITFTGLHVLLAECRPLIKPVWSGCVDGVIFSNALAMALQSILGSTFMNEIGQEVDGSVGSFPGFRSICNNGRVHVWRPCVLILNLSCHLKKKPVIAY